MTPTVRSITNGGHVACRGSPLPTPPMRIAYVTETWPPELNGVSLTVARMVGHLRQRGHRLDLVRPAQPGETRGRDALEWRTAGFALPMYPDVRVGLALPGTLARRFAASRPDLVHLATPGPLAWAALTAARAAGIPVASDFRTNFHTYSRYYGLGFLSGTALSLLRRFHNLTDLTFVPTEAAARDLGAAGFQRVAVVGRGVDTVRFDPAHRREALRAEWGAAPQTPVFLAVGRVAAEKNIELALRAWQAACARTPDGADAPRMVVVGDGPARGRLEREWPGVRFVGARRDDDLAAHYASADVFLFPSLSDTFGNVVLEALASGLPVVAHDCAAPQEHVENGRTGALVTPGDEAGFIAAAVGMVAPAAAPARAAMRPLARAAALRADWAEVLARFEAHLLETADGRQATPAVVPVVA